MKARGMFVSLVVMALAWTLRARSEQPSSQIQPGKYLVESVALCGDCHTPHNEKGEPIQEKWLQGSPLPFKPLCRFLFGPTRLRKSPGYRGGRIRMQSDS